MHTVPCGKIASRHANAASLVHRVARRIVLAGALLMTISPAWSKTPIGTAGDETFVLNNSVVADEIDRLVSAIRTAARNCDIRAHSAAVEALRVYLGHTNLLLLSETRYIGRLEPGKDDSLGINFAKFFGFDPTAETIRKDRDERNADRQDARVLDKFSRFYFSTNEVQSPRPCPPRDDAIPPSGSRGLPPLWVTVQGGGLFTSGDDRNITGTDNFVPGAPEVDRRGLPGSDSSGLIGGTATVTLPIDPPPLFNAPPGKLFLRSGIVVNLSDGLSENVSGINLVPLGSGTVENKVKWYVPVLVGIAIPVAPHVNAELFGGVHISRREASFDLIELGAGPGGLPINASESWTSIDPAIGAGLLFDIGRVNGLPLRITVNGTLAFVGSESLDASSPNFATQSYQFETGRSLETSILFGLSVGLQPQ